MPDQVFCPIRQGWVAAQPEELVRQRLIQLMIHQGGYPLQGIVIEKDLRRIPHLIQSPTSLPRRRADLIFFAKDIHPHHELYPLLLVECKSVKLIPKMIRQVIGYNFYLQAPFIAILNQHDILLGWRDKELNQFKFSSSFLSYPALLAKWHQINHPSIN